MRTSCADYNDNKLRFIVDIESTLEDFNYYRCMEFDSTLSKDVDFPINTVAFLKAERDAKKTFSYYLNFRFQTDLLFSALPEC